MEKPSERDVEIINAMMEVVKFISAIEDKIEATPVERMRIMTTLFIGDIMAIVAGVRNKSNDGMCNDFAREVKEACKRLMMRRESLSEESAGKLDDLSETMKEQAVDFAEEHGLDISQFMKE